MPCGRRSEKSECNERCKCTRTLARAKAEEVPRDEGRIHSGEANKGEATTLGTESVQASEGALVPDARAKWPPQAPSGTPREDAGPVRRVSNGCTSMYVLRRKTKSKTRCATRLSQLPSGRRELRSAQSQGFLDRSVQAQPERRGAASRPPTGGYSPYRAVDEDGITRRRWATSGRQRTTRQGRMSRAELEIAGHARDKI